MGCWNETCGVTQLPINAGDKVRLFVLVSQKHWKEHAGENLGGGVCYSNDLWTPIGPPIQGEYDDYGGIENIVDNDASRLIEAKIAEGWVPVTAKHEWDDMPKKMDLAAYLHFIERGRGFTTGHLQGTQDLGLMMVHEEVYQAMIGFDPIEAHHYWDERTYEYMPLSKGLRLDFEKWYSEQLEVAKEIAETEDEKMKSILSFRLSLGHDNLFGYRDGALHLYKIKLQELALKLQPFESKKVQKVTQEALELFRFQIGMSRARKTWAPQCGKGSQQNDLDIYKAIQAGVEKVVAADLARQEEYGREEPDENGYYPFMIEHNQKRLADAKASK